jgi:hypothetical protein
MALELTEREEAIARGEDPDVVAASNEPESGADDAVETPAAEVDGSQDGQDGSTESGSTEAASESSAEQVKPGTDKTSATWLDDNVKSLGTAYGMTDEDFAEFKSREDFDRTARIFARRLMETGKQGATQTESTPATTQTPPATSTAQEPPVDPFDPKNWEGYDEKTLDLVKSHRETLEKLAKQEQAVTSIVAQAQQADRERYLNFFHSSVDALEPELFGRTIKDGKVVALDQKSDANRAKLWEAVHTIQAGIESRAQQAGKAPVLPPFSELLDSAKRLVFSNELRSAEQSKRSNAIREQAKTRRPAASHRTVGSMGRKPNGQFESGATINDTVSALAKDPQLMSLWNSMQ